MKSPDRPMNERCPKVGKLGQRCTEARHHGGRHKFPPHPTKRPGEAIE